MKKLIAFMLTLVLVVVSMIALAAGDLLEEIKARGYITIATEGNWAPYTYHNDNNDLIGYDVEIGRAIAEALGVEAEFVEIPWDSILAGVETGRFDIACNCINCTEELAEKFSFSMPYLYTRNALVVRSNNKEIKSFKNLKGKKTAQNPLNSYIEIAKEYGAKVVGADNLMDAIMKVVQGTAVATINDLGNIVYYLKEHPETDIKIVQYIERNTCVFPVQKSARTETLLAAVNDALETIREDGTLATLSIKYFDADLTNPAE